MKLGQFLLMALENMGQHKLRTALTLLGLIVGIASVLVMTGIGRGFAQMTEEQLASLLPNKITLRQGYSPDAPPAALTLREVSMLQKQIGRAPLSAVAPRIDLYDLPIKGVDPQLQFVMLVATTADYPQTVQLTFSSGRFFSATEADSNSLVAVVNQSMVNLLQQMGQAEVSFVTIDNKLFRITGVIQDENAFFGGQPQLFIPIGLLQRQLTSQSLQWDRGALAVSQIDVLATDVAQLPAAKRAVERLLRLTYGLRADQPNNFDLQVEREALSFAESFNRGFTLVLAGIGAIALVVGGVGVMNILLASVAERTREIGVRKAIGASDLDILAQFLFESLFICLIGGALGVGLSYSIGNVINQIAGPGANFPMRVLIDQGSVLIACLSSVTCGVGFGLYPALRAMRLDPIQALRYE